MLTGFPPTASTPLRRILRSVTLRGLAIIYLVLAPCGCKRKDVAVQPEPVDAPILLLAVDGLEWDVMLPMLSEGRLPHLARLMQRGSFGLLQTFQPTMSPVIWTSIATGKTPENHGIFHFARAGQSPSDSPILYSNRDRRTKAIWNIAGEYDKRVAVVGWWMTFPVEPVNGVMLAQTNTLQQLDIAKARNVWKGRLIAGLPGQVYPPDRFDEMMRVLSEMDATLPTLTETIFGRFEHPMSLLGERLWDNCLWAFRADATYAQLAKKLLSESEPYDLLAVYFGGPDVVGHRFWRYHQPELYEHAPSDAQVANFGDVIEDYYAYVDRVAGELVEQAGPSTRVLVVSDHGMQPVNLSAQFDPDDPPVNVNSAHHALAEPGVIIVAGPGFRRSAPIKQLSDLTRAGLSTPASVLDIAPTLLSLMGIPVGADMQGRVATALIEPDFTAAHPVKVIPTHDTPEWLTAHRALSGEDPSVAERLEQLRALGYIENE